MLFKRRNLVILAVIVAGIGAVTSAALTASTFARAKLTNFHVFTVTIGCGDY
jgi:hypothetical protein